MDVCLLDVFIEGGRGGERFFKTPEISNPQSLPTLIVSGAGLKSHDLTRVAKKWIQRKANRCTWHLRMHLTWDAKTPVTVARAATHSVGTGVQSAEIYQLGTGGAGETGCAATGKAQRAGTLRGAGSIVVARPRSARIYLQLTCGPLISCMKGFKEMAGIKRGTGLKKMQQLCRSLHQWLTKQSFGDK